MANRVPAGGRRAGAGDQEARDGIGDRGLGILPADWRLDRKAIGLALGSPAGRGTRTVASYDEDPTTMGVEAARRTLAGEGVLTPEVSVSSTPEPPYLDKTNAAAIHAALGGRVVAPDELCGSVRSGAMAMRAAAALGAGRARPWP